MKAIILSAGQGSRLGHLVDDRPKCLIDFGGRTLLDRQLDALAANGVDEAVVAPVSTTSWSARQSRRGPAVPKCGTIYNPFLQGRRQHRSLFMAREELAGEAVGGTANTLGVERP